MGVEPKIVVPLRSTPHPLTVTTRIITFLVGNPYKPSFATVTGWGVDPRYPQIIHFNGAFSIIFTIHFGGKTPPIFGNTQLKQPWKVHSFFSKDQESPYLNLYGCHCSFEKNDHPWKKCTAFCSRFVCFRFDFPDFEFFLG